MSLMFALILLGLAVLLAMVLHAVWSNRRQRELAGAEQVSRLDFAADRAEPAGARLDAQPSRLGPSALAAEPAFFGQAGQAGQASPLESDAGPQTVPDLPQSQRVALRRGQRLDPLIDAIVPLVLEQPVFGEAAIPHLPTAQRAGTKPFYVEGLDAQRFEWELLQPGRRYKELQAGVQLVNRTGPLNEIEYSEFVQKLEAFAEAVSARADIPDMLEVVARARELDAQVGPLDAQLNFRLRANGVGWSVPYLQKVAVTLGFTPSGLPGRLHLMSPEPGTPPLLSLVVDQRAALTNDAQTGAVSEALLVLDVPQVAETFEPFPLMHKVATRLAYALDATPLDAKDQPISLQAYNAINRELGSLYQQLNALDFSAGSQTARRLFS